MTSTARTPPSRVSREKILEELRRASRKGDRVALTLAIEQMKTLALSPRYWEKYLGLLRHPLARLVDLLVIKQGDRIAHQKGWKVSKPRVDTPSARASKKKRPPGRSRRRRGLPALATQPSLFD